MSRRLKPWPDEGRRRKRNLAIWRKRNAQVLIGKEYYERLIKGYTEKQWGRKCTDLPAFIIKRLARYDSSSTTITSMTKIRDLIGGYNKRIHGLLEGQIKKNSVDFFKDEIELPNGNKGLLKDHWKELASKLVFTGKIDEFYNYQFGKLNYRTVRFEQETIDCPNYQGNAVVNYTEREVPYTRVIVEHKHFERSEQKFMRPRGWAYLQGIFHRIGKMAWSHTIR